MADDHNIIEPDIGSTTAKVRSRDLGGSPPVKSQKVDVSPWVPTIVSGFEDLTVSTAAVTLTVPSGATHVLISVSGADVRMRDDGTNPTSTVGLILKDGFVGELPLPLVGGTPQALKFIRAGGTDAEVECSYRKYV